MPACLMIFVKSNNENQLIRFVIAYLVADNNVKRETVAATRGRRLHHSRPMASLQSWLWITGYVEYCSNVFIGNMLKHNAHELKRLLNKA